MKKIILILILIIAFNKTYSSINPQTFFLLFHAYIADKNKEKKESENRCLTIYFKGIEYVFSIDSFKGASVQLLDNNFSHVLNFVIAENIEVEKSSNTFIKMKIPKEADFAKYAFYYSLALNGKSYNWNIKEIFDDTDSSNYILEDTCVIIGNPKDMYFEPFEKHFTPAPPLNIENSVGTVILPRLKIINKNVGCSEFEFCSKIVKEIHQSSKDIKN